MNSAARNFENKVAKFLKKPKDLAAVSFSPDAYRLPAMGFGIWLTGKLGRAWRGAWVVHWFGAWDW